MAVNQEMTLPMIDLWQVVRLLVPARGMFEITNQAVRRIFHQKQYANDVGRAIFAEEGVLRITTE